MNAFTEGLVTIALAVIGLGIVSVLVSKNATTGSLIQNAASGLGNDIATAQSPVTGTQITPDLSYANSFGSTFGS